MQTQQRVWVCRFRDRPDVGDVEVVVEEAGRPRQVVAREREGAGGLVDGYILQSVGAGERTAVYAWVRAGTADRVAAYLLELLAEVCPGSEPDRLRGPAGERVPAGPRKRAAPAPHPGDGTGRRAGPSGGVP